MISKQFAIQHESKYCDFSECPLGLFLYNGKLYIKTDHSTAFDFEGKELMDASLPVDIHVQSCSVFEPFEPFAEVDKKEDERKNKSVSGTITTANRMYAETLCEKTTNAVVGAFKEGVLKYLNEDDAKTVLNYLTMENWSFTSNLVATLCWLVDTKGSLTLEGKLNVFGKELKEAYLNVMKQYVF